MRSILLVGLMVGAFSTRALAQCWKCTFESSPPGVGCGPASEGGHVGCHVTCDGGGCTCGPGGSASCNETMRPEGVQPDGSVLVEAVAAGAPSWRRQASSVSSGDELGPVVLHMTSCRGWVVSRRYGSLAQASARASSSTLSI